MPNDTVVGARSGAPIDVTAGALPIYPSATILPSPRLLPRFDPTSAASGSRGASTIDSLANTVLVDNVTGAAAATPPDGLLGSGYRDTASGHRGSRPVDTVVPAWVVVAPVGSISAAPLDVTNGAQPIYPTVGLFPSPRLLPRFDPTSNSNIGNRGSSPQADTLTVGVTVTDQATGNTSGAPSGSVATTAYFDAPTGHRVINPSDKYAFISTDTGSGQLLGAGTDVILIGQGVTDGAVGGVSAGPGDSIQTGVVFVDAGTGQGGSSPVGSVGLFVVDVAAGGDSGAPPDMVVFPLVGPGGSRRSWYHAAFYVAADSLRLTDTGSGSATGSPGDAGVGWVVTVTDTVGGCSSDSPTGTVSALTVVAPSTAGNPRRYHPLWYMAPSTFLLDGATGGTAGVGVDSSSGYSLTAVDVPLGQRSTAAADAVVRDLVVVDKVFGNCSATPTTAIVDVYQIDGPFGSLTVGAPDTWFFDLVAADPDSITGSNASPADTAYFDTFVTEPGSFVGQVSDGPRDSVAVSSIRSDRVTGYGSANQVDTWGLSELDGILPGAAAAGPADSLIIDELIGDVVVGDSSGSPTDTLLLDIILGDFYVGSGDGSPVSFVALDVFALSEVPVCGIGGSPSETLLRGVTVPDDTPGTNRQGAPTGIIVFDIIRSSPAAGNDSYSTTDTLTVTIDPTVTSRGYMTSVPVSPTAFMVPIVAT